MASINAAWLASSFEHGHVLNAWQKGFSRLGYFPVYEAQRVEFVSWYCIQLETLAPSLCILDDSIQIPALSAFHTNHSKKTSMLPCALADKTIGICTGRTRKQVVAKILCDRDLQK